MITQAQGQTTALFERIAKIGQWVGVPHDLKDDLIQEAWILCTEYAQKRGKPIESLSNTEIRLRCFEARRKILPQTREVLVDDISSFCDSRESQNALIVPSQQETLEDIMRDEEIRKQSANLEKLQWVLEVHPTLKLTPRQAELWQIYRGSPYGRWRADRARNLGVTRQNVSNIVRVVRKKAEAAADLIRLWEGDVLPFFEKYGKEWARTPVRKLIWDVLRYHTGVDLPLTLREHFIPLQSAMVDYAYGIFDEQRMKMGQNGEGDAAKLAMGYNLLISGVHIEPADSVTQKKVFQLRGNFSQDVPRIPWVLYRFVERAAHLADGNARGDHRAQLKEWIYTKVKEGRAFANYALAYYECVDIACAHKFIAHDGKCDFPCINYAPMISRLYNNARIPRYSTSTVWMDINFLRIALAHAHYSLSQNSISNNSRNALITICQKSLHSRDPFVVSQAERLLHTLKNLQTPHPSPLPRGEGD